MDLGPPGTGDIGILLSIVIFHFKQTSESEEKGERLQKMYLPCYPVYFPSTLLKCHL